MDILLLRYCTVCLTSASLFSLMSGSASAADVPVKPCGSYFSADDPPVKLEEMSETWRYAKDADKLPVIQELLANERLKPRKNPPNAPFCKALRRDLLAGRHIMVIEPEFQVLTQAASEIQPWLSCKGGTVWEGRVPWRGERPYERLDGVPPYRLYRIELDGKLKNGPEPVVVSREAGTWSGQMYRWVDMDKCEVRHAAQVSSMRDCKVTPNTPDAISLVIRYKKIVGVLSHTPWGDDERNEKIVLSTLGPIGAGYCSWTSHQ